MLGIMAGMDQKDRCSGTYKAGIAGYNAPRAVFSSLVRCPFLDPMVLTVQNPVEFAQVQFLDEVVIMPVVGQRLALMVQTFPKSVEFPQVQFLVWDVDMLAVGQRLALMVQTVQMPVEVPQVLYLDKDVLIPVIARPLQYRNPWSSHRCCSWTRL